MGIVAGVLEARLALGRQQGRHYHLPRSKIRAKGSNLPLIGLLFVLHQPAQVRPPSLVTFRPTLTALVYRNMHSHSWHYFDSLFPKCPTEYDFVDFPAETLPEPSVFQ
jgi:hypothetical protein